MKKSRMREMSIEVTVGAFMFMVLLALGIFTIVLSRESIFSQNYNYTVAFDEVLGLREGDNVYVRGVDVGKVRTIQVTEKQVELVASLEIELELHEDYAIEILPTSVLGGRYLLIDEGTDRAPRLKPGAVLKGTTPVDLVEEASETITMVRRALSEGGIISDLQNTMSNINVVTYKLRSGEGTMGRLIMEDQLYLELNQITKDLRLVSDRLATGQGTIGKLFSTNETLYAELEQVVSDIRTVSSRLADGEGLLGKLLSDEDELYDDLQATARNLRDISDRLNSGEGALGELLAGDSSVQADLKASMASIRRITAAIDEGEGTLGLLVRDPGLYTELTNAVSETRAALDDIRETSPISTLTDVFFGAF